MRELNEMGYGKPLACSKLVINYRSPQLVEIWWGGFLTEKGLGKVVFCSLETSDSKTQQTGPICKEDH